MTYLPLIVAAAVAFAIGGLWYSVLFHKPWMRLMGIDPQGQKKGFAKALVAMFVTELVMAYVLSIVLAAMGAYSLATGIEASFWMWLGFVATIGVSQVLFEKRSWKLFAITYGYHLVALLAMGAILTLW